MELEGDGDRGKWRGKVDLEEDGDKDTEGDGVVEAYGERDL